jgi:carboxyl-terminal processing protease
MEPTRRPWIAVLAVVALALSTFSFGFLVGGRRAEVDPLSADEGARGLASIRDAFESILESSVEPPTESDLARGAIKGMIRVLRRSGDPYALFYTPSGYQSFQELTSGRFSGIGVWLKEKGRELEIVSVLPSSPALGAGLRRGDVIRSVNGRPVEEMTVDEAVAHIKGRRGTQVTLGIDREDEQIFVTVTRASIELPNLKASVTAQSLGYIRLFGFARGAGEQVRNRVEDMTESGVEGIVLDLRDNGGGLFSEAVEVASVFIEDGKIVTYRSRVDDEVTYEAEGDAFEDLPVVVVVNEGTASASEIVAGALQDTGRAIVVGAQTYGKGSVQEVVPLLNASALKLTTGAYLTPSGQQINGEGIEPDVEVASDDPPHQRQRAVEILRGIVLSTSGAQG